MQNANFRTVEDKQVNIDIEKNNKSHVKIELNNPDIINEKSFMTEIDINFDDVKNSEPEKILNMK